MEDGTYDRISGKAKEAAGDLTGDEEMKREGQADQLAGSAKEKAAAVVDTVKDAVGKLVDKVRAATSRGDDQPERSRPGEPD